MCGVTVVMAEEPRLSAAVEHRGEKVLLRDGPGSRLLPCLLSERGLEFAGVGTLLGFERDRVEFLAALIVGERVDELL